MSNDDLNFIRLFVIHSGSLKDLSREYGVSYPTIRHKLDLIIKKLNLSDVEFDTFRNQMMQLVIERKLDFDTANRVINLHEKTVKGENNNV